MQSRDPVRLGVDEEAAQEVVFFAIKVNTNFSRLFRIRVDNLVADKHNVDVPATDAEHLRTRLWQELLHEVRTLDL